MANLKLTGGLLKAAVAASRQTVARDAVLGVMRSGHDLNALMELPATCRGALPTPQAPLQAAPPRMWEDAGLEPPEPATWRVTTRRLRSSWASGQSSPQDALREVRTAAESGRFGKCTYSPYIAVDWERAAHAAAESTLRWAEGRPLSPLDGVPVPVKDELHMVGLPTRGGTGRTPPLEGEDAPVVELLRAAGAIPYAKTHSTEWGMCPIGTNAHHALPRNPWHKDRAAGGSSTGTAVAVALGHSPVGVGSDGGGSIRIPSSLCGLVGLKPTFCRLSRRGGIFGGGSVAALGPIAHATEDLVELMVLTGLSPDPLDAPSSWAPRVDDQADRWRAALGRGVKGARIGVPTVAWKDADPRIAALCQTALRALQREGAVLVDLDTTLLQRAQGIGVLAIGPETMALLDEDYSVNRDDYSLQLQLTLNALRQIPAREVLVAQRLRNGLREECAALLNEVDVIALPTTALPAAPYPAVDGALDMAADEYVRAMCRFNFVANVTGLPAGSVTVGKVEDAPVGLQFVGDAWDEASVLACLAHVERLGIADLHPPEGYLNLLQD